MKKLMINILAIIMVLSLQCATVSAEPEQTHQIGDVIGQVLSTDIKSYIDDVPVTSYNIGGRTAIIIQHVANRGFTMSFDEQTRVLSVSGDGIASFTEEDYKEAPLNNEVPVGTPVKDVQYTDIVATFDGQPMESFNIESLTAVFIDELAQKCGAQYIWDENARTVKVYTDKWQKPETTSVMAESLLDANINPMTHAVSQRRWGETAVSHLIENSDGSFYTVEVGEYIYIEKYDSNLQYSHSFAIRKEMELFGGLFVGRDYNYIAFGQTNYNEDNSREVIKIVIYNKDFVKISEVPISNCKTAVPFDASAGQMAENDRYLVLHTSRSQYKDANGQRPQTQLTIIIDKHTWQPCNMLGKFQYNHTSHALRELTAVDGDSFVTVDLSDAAPLRGVIFRKMKFDGTVTNTQALFNVPGQLAANCTGVMPGGLAVSDTSYLTVMSSIDHSKATSYDSINIQGVDTDFRDIYLIAVDKETLEQTHYILGKYSGSDIGGSTPYIVPVDGGRFMVLWNEFNKYGDSQGIRYALVNGRGQTLKNSGLIWQASGNAAILSADCQPIFANGKVIWYVNNDNGRIFYSINMADVKEDIVPSPIETAPSTASPEVESSTPKAEEEITTDKKDDAPKKESALLKYKDELQPQEDDEAEQNDEEEYEEVDGI